MKEFGIQWSFWKKNLELKNKKNIVLHFFPTSPKYLLVFFSLKKGYDLKDKKALHTQIRRWCEETLRDYYYDEHAVHITPSFCKKMMTEEVLEKKLSKR